MRPEWEKGLRGRVYAWGRSVVPLSWRRAIRRRFAPERLLGIRKPPVDVVRYDFDARDARPGRPDLLFLPVIAWSYRRQRPQQLAEALGRRGKRVFYGSVEGSGEPREATGVAPGVTLVPIAGVRREDPGDRRLQGPALETALGSIAAARDEFGLRECAVVVESPFWAPLALRLRERFRWDIVYDCLDEHGAFAKYRPGALREEEDLLSGSADLVLATSPILLERLSARARHARLLPNGCDYELFAAVPDPVPRSETITVGYVGAVDDWFDAPLFDELARLRPSWRFEVVGADEGAGSSRPRRAANVLFHGERPHDELPALRARFDVEIIPFRLTPLTHAVDPVKLYEAAAAGRPVVATPMRSLARLAEQGLVRPASTAGEFARQIEAAAGASASERRRLREFARENTWDIRAAELDGSLAALRSRVSASAARETDPSQIALAGRRAGALFVFPESVPWGTTLVQRPHHLARALARRGFPVVFETEASGSDGASRTIEDNLHLVAGRIGERMDAPLVYWSFPYNVPEPSRLSGARLVYDVIDHPDVFPHRRSLLRRNHERALGAADAVFAVSRPLCEEISRRRPDAVYLPNGVDFERYEGVPDPAGVPETLIRSRQAGRPVAGFLGAFARWVDAGLLCELARLRPDWDLTLIGEPLDDSFDAVGRRGAPSNLVFAGPVPHRSVPATLSALDAGLVPFRLGPEGANASPIKLYEYLAAGLPVLATPIPEATSIPEVLVATDAAGFAALLDQALSLRRSEEYRERARARARENDWSARAERALASIPRSPAGRAVSEGV